MASALIIAGWDPTGGAGMAADLRAFESFGFAPHGLLSCVTSQTHSRFIQMASPGLDLQEQLDSVTTGIQVLKTGWLPQPDHWSLAADWVQKSKVTWICDPVLGPTAKGFHRDLPVEAIRKALPHMTLITPNVKEARLISGAHDADGPALAKMLVEMGAQAAFVTGGDSGARHSVDAFWSSSHQFCLQSPRLKGSFRGTGCMLASAIAAHLIEGAFLEDAVVLAKGQLFQALSLAQPEKDQQPRVISRLPAHFDLPSHAVKEASPFAKMDRPIGFYPIFDRFAWFEKIHPYYPPTVQIRIKDLQGAELKKELTLCIDFCRKHDIRCFVNDFWELAIELGAFGVHLGQEDLDHADFHSLRQAGLRLGVSTHSEWELVRAIALKPSYVALGPVFPTQLKQMRHGPQGLERLRQWVSWSPFPVVGIGGIYEDMAKSVQETGCDGIAVVSAITAQSNPRNAMKSWLDLLL